MMEGNAVALTGLKERIWSDLKKIGLGSCCTAGASDAGEAIRTNSGMGGANMEEGKERG